MALHLIFALPANAGAQQLTKADSIVVLKESMRLLAARGWKVSFKGGFRTDIPGIPRMDESPVGRPITREIETSLVRISENAKEKTVNVTLYFNVRGDTKCVKIANVPFMFYESKWISRAAFVSETCERVNEK